MSELNKNHGYHNQYLKIDLTTNQKEICPIPSEVLRQYIGGSGLGTWILLKETPSNLDPLSPEAPLVFVFSPLVGSSLTTSAKFSVMGKSPLTNRINDSLASSTFAITGKKTGFDAIVITGKCPKLSHLVINNSDTQIKNAAHLKGLSTSSTEAKLKSELGNNYQSMVIGPAGEAGVLYATITHDGRHSGRGGMGAVMGSKNLKSISVHGDQLTSYAHKKELNEYSKNLAKKSLGAATEKYRELGTIGNLSLMNRMGSLPTRNFQSGTFENAESLSVESLSNEWKTSNRSCTSCNIGCEKFFHLENNKKIRSEYENLFALGPLCGIHDSQTVLLASAFCDDLGMDTISTGATIAFAMECSEKKLIDEPGLTFGKQEALLKTIQLISRKKGIGDLLSQGTRIASRKIGNGSEDFAPHVKGLEIPGYEPRSLQTMALGFAVNHRGADHNRSGAYQVDFSKTSDRFNPDEESVLAAIEVENESALLDSLILCKFVRKVFKNSFSEMAEILTLITGWSYNEIELREAAERIICAKKWYNITQGWQPGEDTLPKRFLTEKLPDGVSKDAVIDETKLNQLIKKYYLARRWNLDGFLPESVVNNLNLHQYSVTSE